MHFFTLISFKITNDIYTIYNENLFNHSNFYLKDFSI